ncbi:hypothetical protein ACHAXA_005264 [Cyclostephanos tholiformis]|uniref:Uncharacterized protein n=1 Tax=Cyclostephanos tholiformis TaxID=382380 RepID=A0ABD3R5A8_9STRA
MAGSYSLPGWSNRLGSVLTPASIPGVYTADRPFYWNGIDVGGRMTVIKMERTSGGDGGGRGGLIVHSPVYLDAPLVDALSRLGDVMHVISPNYEHVKYVRAWAEHYPNARVWGCPGLTSRVSGVEWSGEVPYGARPNAADGNGTSAIDGMWDWNELMPYHVDFEVNPFTGRPFFNEVLFYHVPSRTLLTTDFYWNYPGRDGATNGRIVDDADDDDGDYGSWELAPNVGPIPLGSLLWGKVGMDRLFYPFYIKFMVRKDRRDAFEEMARYMTCGGGGGDDDAGWVVETIIPCHGDIVRGRRLCRKVLERHFGIKS